MKQVLVLPSFERCVKKMTVQEKKNLAKGLGAFNALLTTGQAPHGFRFKKINHDKYEFRIDIRLRAVVKTAGNIYYLVLVGSHEDIRRYLKN